MTVWVAAPAFAHPGQTTATADSVSVSPGGCLVTYADAAELKIVGAEVNGLKLTSGSSAGTRFRAERIVLVRESASSRCSELKRVELEGDVNYESATTGGGGLERMNYFPETDTMSARGPDGGAATIGPLQRRQGFQARPPVRHEGSFRF